MSIWVAFLNERFKPIYYDRTANENSIFVSRGQSKLQYDARKVEFVFFQIANNYTHYLGFNGHHFEVYTIYITYSRLNIQNIYFMLTINVMQFRRQIKVNQNSIVEHNTQNVPCLIMMIKWFIIWLNSISYTYTTNKKNLNIDLNFIVNVMHHNPPINSNNLIVVKTVWL